MRNGIGEQTSSTPMGLTEERSGPFRAGRFFPLCSVGFTHGYSRSVPSGTPA